MDAKRVRLRVKHKMAHLQVSFGAKPYFMNMGSIHMPSLSMNHEFVITVTMRLVSKFAQPVLP